MRFRIGISFSPKQLLGVLGAVIAALAALVGTGVIQL